MIIDPQKIKEDFPIFKNNKNLVYFDNAAMSQKPKIVLDKVMDYYQNYNANVHRGVYALSEKATLAYEGVREKVRAFINAKSTKEIIFTRNATGAANLVAFSFIKTFLKPGDTILLTDSEHHSNFVSWQLWAKLFKVNLKSVPLLPDGKLDYNKLDELLNDKSIKLFSCGYVSNSTGIVHDIHNIISKCKEKNIKVCIDASQAVPHMKVDVQNLNCDFLFFTGHKMLAPTGVGVLYGSEELLEQMEPYEGGGDMIHNVDIKETTFNILPYKFEAGTPNVAGVIGLGAAIDYINNIGIEKIHKHELLLTEYALEIFNDLNDIEIVGSNNMKNRAGIISFLFNKLHPHDVATILDQEGIALRAGHHCAQMVMNTLDISSTLRVSFYLYNSKEEIDYFFEKLDKVKHILGA